MRLAARLRVLEGRAPEHRPAAPLPADPVAFARGLLAGAFGVEDIEPTDPSQTGWVARLGAFLGTLSPEHQAWLRLQRERHPRAYPGAVLLPEPDEAVLAALDEVMRRG